MKYQPDFHTSIAIEYEEAYTWYEERSQGLGERFLLSVREKLEQIAEQPFIFGERSKKRIQGGQNKQISLPGYLQNLQTKKIIFINTIHHTSKHPQKKYRK